ncbi:MAG: acetyl-CoA carboxylase biotin carboxyl carrier protein subunit [Bacteroidota bacterium]
MALDLRTADRSLTLDRKGNDVTADGEPLDVRHTTLRAPIPGAETLLMVVGGRPRVVTVERDGARTTVWVDGQPIDVAVRTEADVLLERFGLDAGDAAADREVRAPMPGLVLRVLAQPGSAVEAGDGLVVLEAMKMENELTAPADGTVASVHAAAGDAVGKGDLLVELE